jgi:hypothetical protein
MSTDVSPEVTPGYKTNSKQVAVLGASDGHGLAPEVVTLTG